MRSGRPVVGLVRRTIRRREDALRVLRYQKATAVLRLSEALPVSARRRLFAPVERIAARLGGGRGDHPVSGPLRAIALYGQGRTGDAAAYADALVEEGGRRTATRLAGIAIAARDSETAGRILATVPDDDATLGLRGEQAYLAGRYGAAADLLRGAVALSPRNTSLARTLARAEAEAAILAPGWQPDVGPPARLRAPRAGRILHLLTNSLPYREAGYTVRSQSVARCQLAVGLDPQMVTRAGFPRSDGVGSAADHDVVDGVTYHRLRPDLEPGLVGSELASATATAAVGLIARLRPALLQPTSNYPNARVALALGEKFGIPVVYEVRGFLEETWLSRAGSQADADRYRSARDAETDCMRRVDAIVTLSDTMRADIVGRGGIDPDRVTVVPNAVDVERFKPGPRDDALAATLGIGRDTAVIGYISSFSAYEGIRYLIEAAAILRARGRRIKLLLVGDGDDGPELQALAARSGLLADGTAIFTGRIPHRDILRYYRTIDVFVVPRTNDRVSQLVTPLKPYEAMAMEKALVVSAVPALLEVTLEGQTGHSFVPGDAVSLADTVEPLLDDPARRARLGAAARAWVAANRTWTHNGERYRKLYERLGVT